MKKNLAFVLVLIVLTISGLSMGNVQAFSLTADTPYVEDTTQYFESTDPCGYVMGTADPYPVLAPLNPISGTVKLTVQGNNVQGCFDANGYAYSSSTSSPTRDARATFSYTTTGASGYTNYTIDFTGSNYQVVIDQTTGIWSGWGRITDGTIPSAQRWVKFDWVCRTGACSSAGFDSSYYVTTDLTTGEVSGYAWSDYFNNFIQFTGLTQELPPRQVDMYVDVLSSDGTSGPEDVTAEDAPIADGYDYWRVRLQFVNDAGENLEAGDISSIAITPSSTGTVYLNQVQNAGDAITESDSGTMVQDPSTGTWSTCSTTGACVLTESVSDGGTTSWNTFIRSASPTSNMIGLQNDSDAGIDALGDRDGCRWIYYDQWHEVDGSLSQPSCGSMPKWYYKADYFYDRVNDRNQYILDSLDIDVTFAAANTTLATNTYTTQVDSDSYTYTVHDSAGTSGQELSWRPRYQLADFSALYDGASHDQISSDITKTPMSLKTTATVSDTSDAFYAALGLRRPGYAVKYQMDVEKSTSDPTDADLELLVDTAADAVGDCTRRTDTVSKSYGASGVAYTGNYALKYGQKSVTTCGGVAGPVPNTVSDPTAEQWVCDNLRGDVDGQNPQLSCYFTGYLSRIDRHVDPESMLVIGAINSTLSQNDLLSNDSTISMIGAGTNTIKLRNKMYAQIVRDTLGVTLPTATHSLDSAMEDSSGTMAELLGGRLYVTGGDLVIDGSTSFSSRTAVSWGGDVIINGNITGGRLGIIALKDSNGDGGNVYIAPGVTEIYGNVFADGSVLSYDGVTVPSDEAVFDWDGVGGDETRLATLLNQLYWSGSLVARNTVNGADTTDATVTSWAVGDGTTTTDYDTAREHDLNMLRQYRRCYQLDSSGNLDLSLPEVDCGEGELLSTYGTDNTLYNSFILDYSPADELPIFRAESGLFQ